LYLLLYLIRETDELYANHVFRVASPHNAPLSRDPGQGWREFETEIGELVADQFGISLQSQSFWADIQNSTATIFGGYNGREQNPLPPITASVGVRISLGIDRDAHIRSVLLAEEDPNRIVKDFGDLMIPASPTQHNSTPGT
jgi:hypothetical protein